MNFTRYFSAILKERGTPDVNVNEYQRMLNIIVLENKIDLLRNLQSRERHANRKHFLKVDIMKYQNQLNQLTMENRPENLLKYMLNKSKFEN